MGGACTSCNNVTTMNEIPIEQFPKANKIVPQIKNLLTDFAEYQIQKDTHYEYRFSQVFRKMEVIQQKKLTSKGLVAPIDLNALKNANEALRILKSQYQNEIDPNMSFKCALQLNAELPTLMLQFLFKDVAEQFDLNKNGYTLIRSWNQGEQMVNFEHALDLKLPDLTIIGLTRGNEDTQTMYKELVKSNEGWANYRHIFVETDHPSDDGTIFDIYFNEETLNCEDGQMSALLFKGNKLIWKRYINEWEVASDSDEVAIGVKDAYYKQAQHFSKVEQHKQSNNKQDEYQKIKNIIKNQTESSAFTRDLQIAIKKTTLYGKNKVVIIQPPILDLNSSIKSQQVVDQLATKVQGVNKMWNKQLLTTKISDLMNKNKLKILAVLEKVIRVKITWEGTEIQIQTWEQASLTPHYASTSQIPEIKNWIACRDSILPELQREVEVSVGVEKRVNEMVLQLMRQIPTVDQLQVYGRIPYAEKRKPPYEEMQMSKSMGNEEIRRRDGMVLLILLIDYENEDTVDLVKQLVDFKVKNKADHLQIAILGHIRAESWTKTFQAYMENCQLASAAGDVIETWFPVEDKIGSVSFAAMLSKMYGMYLERKDCMIIDKNDRIAKLDSSRRIIPNIQSHLNQLSAFQQPIQIDYKTQWHALKSCIRLNDIKAICDKIKCKEDDDIFNLEARQQTLINFDTQISITKKHTQPIRIQRGNLNVQELGSLIQKYVPDKDIQLAK